MKNRIIIFSKNQIKNTFLNVLLGLGYNNFSVLMPSSFEECVLLCQEKAETSIVLCDNQVLDSLLESIKKDGDNFELFLEQAVTLKREDEKMLFVPLEVNIEPFVKEFLGEGQVKTFSIFGKSVATVENIFNSVRCDYKIITKSPILHTVYCFGDVNEDIIKSAFGDSLYSLQNESLAACCARALHFSGRGLCVLEQATAGLVCGQISAQEQGLIKNSYLILNNNDFVKFGIPEEVTEMGISKELAFAVAKELIKKSTVDLTLSVLGEGNRYFISIGSKQEIHVFSTTFEGENGNILGDVVDFALFRLLKTL